MSLASWKREFYPITAKQAAKNGDLEACEHSLKKWQGALTVALKRHDGVITLRDDYHGLDFDLPFEFEANECALCQRHLYGPEDSCDQCPIVLSGEIACTEKRSAYQVFIDDGDPKPMIAALKKALAHIKKTQVAK